MPKYAFLIALLLSSCTIAPLRQSGPNVPAPLPPQPAVPAEERAESVDEPVTGTGLQAHVGERLLPSGVLEIGNTTAPVSLLLFTNHSCNYCQDFEQDLIPPLVSEFIRKDIVRLAVVPYQLAKYPASEQAALMLLCAAEQGKGIAVHELLFRDNLTSADVRAELNAMELDSARHQECMQSEGMKGTIAAQQSMAQSLGVTLVPTYFINGQKYVGLPSFADLRGQIQEVLEE